MNIGDKMYCIKSITMSNNYKQFENGQSYTIKSLFPDSNKIYINYIGRDGDTYMSGFYMKNIPQGGVGWHLFSDHFIDLRQKRKQKLKKLNERRR